MEDKIGGGREYCDALHEMSFLNPITIQKIHYDLIPNFFYGMEKEIGELQEFFQRYNCGRGVPATKIKDGHILVVKNGKYRPYFEFWMKFDKRYYPTRKSVKQAFSSFLARPHN